MSDNLVRMRATLKTENPLPGSCHATVERGVPYSEGVSKIQIIDPYTAQVYGEKGVVVQFGCLEIDTSVAHPVFDLGTNFGAPGTPPVIAKDAGRTMTAHEALMRDLREFGECLEAVRYGGAVYELGAVEVVDIVELH